VKRAPRPQVGTIGEEVEGENRVASEDESRRLELYGRMNKVVMYWTEHDPVCADQFMAHFFIHYLDLEQLEQTVRSAELSLEDHLQDLSRDSAPDDPNWATRGRQA